jgi:hypothetical protein
MQTAGARALREDDNEMSREAVLLEWERKIEVAESRDSGRFVRSPDEENPKPDAPAPAAVTEDATKPEPRRFERAAEGKQRARPAAQPPVSAELTRPAGAQPGRRTITITGQPTRPRRRTAMVEARLAQPDRIALWAFLLGLILVAVAAGTAHA